ncbi:MAG: transcriptional regulator, LuxR family, partial [Chthonomonadales bacterium]|nr:transcriptional regulator, LuxR family [Chthonomonadales bacterium]
LTFLPRSSALDKGESQGVTLQGLLDSEAVQLFVERARMVQPTFALTRSNARPLAQACIRLDGIPLAIELAAVWVRSLSVEEINTRLDNCFRLLTRGSRTALPRQQTLRALIDWSYDLLTPEEQTLFARLSVFAGGWTLEAADSLCASQESGAEGASLFPEDVLDVLTCLIDKSLVIYVPGEESVGRYRLMETVRTYAAERLAERGEAETMRRRHRDCFLAFAETAEPKLAGAEQSEWLERLEAEHDNLRAALEWTLIEADTGEGLRLCGALSRFWMRHAHYAEGREWCARVLARGAAQERTEALARTLNCAGGLAYIQTDYASARAHWAETLSIQRKTEDRKGLGVSLNNLGLVANAQGDLAAAKAYFGESLSLWQEIGDRTGVANAFSNLGLIASAQGDDTSARTHHEESLALRKEIKDRHGMATSLNNLGMVTCVQGDPLTSRNYILEGLGLYQELGDRRGIAMSLNNLGGVACVQGDYGSARSYLVESLALWKEIGERRGMAYSLEAFADLAFRESDPIRAATLWGVAATLRAAIGSPLKPNERAQHEHNIASVREVLGEATFPTAWATGCAMTTDQAVAYILEATE